MLACAILMMAMGLQIALPNGGADLDPGGLAIRRPRLVSPPLAPGSSAILAMPIFAPDRRPSETATAGAAGGGGLAAYAALGSATGGRTASVVLAGPDGAARAVRRGEMVNGWRLTGVDRAKAVFERDGARQVLVIGAPAEAPAPAANP